MNKLVDLLEGLEYLVVKGSLDRTVSQVVIDSRKASENCMFICISGFTSDGHEYAEAAVTAGASVLIVEKDIDMRAIDNISKDVTVIRVHDSRIAMALISASFYDHPSGKLKVIGITGTKGKTTTTYLVKSVLENAGFKVGLIGTIEIIIGDTHIPAKNTTPESFDLQGYFRRMVDEGIEIVVMEVASQGLKLHRTAGVEFEVGVFTNLSADHIGPNEHDSFEDYMECKSRLFRQCRHGIVNVDDEHLMGIIKDHTCALSTFGFNENSDIFASDVRLIKEPGELGVSFDVKGEVNMKVSVPMPGKFTVYNALAAISICRYFNVSKDVIVKALSEASVKGRIEIVKTPYPFTLIIDYAHNAMSLESILTSLREYGPNRLICLFGCGGNRSKDRRFEMGEVSGKMADITIITSDNPRNEEPQAIIDDIKTGISKTKGRYEEIIDRKDAIRYAMSIGRKNDIIVLAGKGHEDYQEIKGIKYPMDERVLIREILEEK